MLDKDFVEQSKMKEHVHNSLENRLQEIGLSDAQFVQNRLRMCNSFSVDRVKPFFVRPIFIPQRV
jgi:hypothetical protein